MIHPSVIVVDECMSSWRGYEKFMQNKDTIHVQKIARKPKGVEIELKAAADGGTGILPQLEIQEGNLNQRPLRYQTDAHKLPFHCAVVLRLVEHWASRGITVIADAAFGSVRTAHELFLRGFFALLVVKGCSVGFPKEYFNDWAKKTENRGVWKTLQTSFHSPTGRIPMTAVVWIAKSGMVKTFIGTCSTTLRGPDLNVPRSKRVEEEGVWVKTTTMKPTARPQLVADLFEHFSTIDYHDRLRQGYLKMEIQWKTHSWWKRLFTTLLGMIFTDSYFAYRHDYYRVENTYDEVLSYYDFLDKLSYSLIHIKSKRVTRPQKRKRSVEEAEIDLVS